MIVTIECEPCKSKHTIYPTDSGYHEYQCGCGKVVRVTSPPSTGTIPDTEQKQYFLGDDHT